MKKLLLIIVSSLYLTAANAMYICDENVLKAESNEFNWLEIKETVILKDKSESLAKLKALVLKAKYSKSELTETILSAIDKMILGELNTNMIVDINPMTDATEILAGHDLVTTVACENGINDELVNIAHIVSAVKKIHVSFL